MPELISRVGKTSRRKIIFELVGKDTAESRLPDTCRRDNFAHDFFHGDE